MNKNEFTKRCLADALFDLLKEKKFEDISIQDIVDRANFSRMAYYRNFKSIKEIAIYFLNSYIMGVYAKKKIPDNPKNASDAFRNFLAILADERIKEITTVFCKQDMLYIVSETCRDRIIAFGNPEEKYYNSFVAGGMIAVWANWVENGYQETPEELIEILHQQIDAKIKNFN